MIGDVFGKSLDVLKKDFIAWVLMGLVLTLAGSIIPLVGGLLLLPNALREGERAILEGRSPQVGELFNFSNLGLDFVSMLLYVLMQTLGSLLCCVGMPIAWIGFWFSAELAADGKVSATDTLKLSWAWSTSHLGDTIALAAISLALNSAGASLGMGIGILCTMPLTLIAWILYWGSVREQVYALAHQKGIAVATLRQTPPA